MRVPCLQNERMAKLNNSVVPRGDEMSPTRTTNQSPMLGPSTETHAAGVGDSTATPQSMMTVG